MSNATAEDTIDGRLTCCENDHGQNQSSIQHEMHRRQCHEVEAGKSLVLDVTISQDLLQQHVRDTNEMLFNKKPTSQNVPQLQHHELHTQ